MDQDRLREGNLDDSCTIDSFLREFSGEFPPASFLPFPGEGVGGADGRRYEVLELVGGGGMGRVFRALDTELLRTVALKFLLPRPREEEPALMDALREEAQALASLDHESIVRIHDVSEWRPRTDGGLPAWRVPFLVMEFLEGESLHALLRRRTLGLQQALDVMVDVAAGLAHAHERRLIHRDLKPGNILIVPGGRARLLDFGLAELLMARGSGRHAPQAGTPAYMAPEQWRGLRPDERTDVWAAGLVLFEMLAGEPPFARMPPAELRKRLTSDAPLARVRERRAELPEEVERLLDSMLAREPRERFPSGAALLRELEALRERLALRPRGPREGLAERRQVTLVSCRLSPRPGAMEHLEPEELGELQGAFHGASSRIIHQHGGVVATCLGAEVLACFGYARASEDDSERAVRAALELKEALPRELPPGPWPQGLGVRVGLTTDEVALDETTPALHGAAPSLQGEAPRVAAWLASQALEPAVLLSEGTRVLVRGRFETAPLGSRTFEGLSGPASLPVHEVLRERDDVSRFERTLVLGELTPLVGRRRELWHLLLLRKEALEGQGAFILLRGEAGIGKSRLLQELHDRAPAEPTFGARCQCGGEHMGTAHAPLIDWLRRFLELSDEDTPSAWERTLAARLQALGLEEQLAPLSAFLSLPLPEGTPFARLTPERQRALSLDALVLLLRRLASRRPVVFLMEDLHWADPSTLEFLGVLLGHVRDSRLCVLLTARPEFRPGWEGRPGFHALELGPLSVEESAALVGEVARERSLPAEVVERLTARADGIPLFLEEVTRMLLERTGPEVGIPATLRELLLARLDRLSSRAKALARLAATLGREFPLERLRAVSFLEERALPRELDALERAGVLFRQGAPPHVTYAFRHALFQEAAYQSLLRKTRRSYHARIARVLDERFPELRETEPELLAHHATQAGVWERAVEMWRRAGQRAAAKSAFAEATGHFTQALALVSNLPPSRDRDHLEVALRVELGQVLVSTRGFTAPEVEAVYVRARELCEQLGETSLCVLWGLFTLMLIRGDREGTERLAALLQRLAETRDEPKTRMLAHAKLSTWAFWRGEYALSRYHGGQVKRLAARHGLAEFMPPIRGGEQGFITESMLYATLFTAYSELLMGQVEQARRDYAKALDLANAMLHPYATTIALVYGAELAYELGEVEEAFEASGRALTLCAERGLLFLHAKAQCIRGGAAALLGRTEEGLASAREGFQSLSLAGARMVLPYYAEYRVQACLSQGALDEGRAVVREALDTAEVTGTRCAVPELWRLAGELSLRAGEPEAAREALMRARTTAHALGAVLHEARATRTQSLLPEPDAPAAPNPEGGPHHDDVN
ncbi:protein kinase [Myxococcus sp. RHSTA-1-4]|uniref:protein kinase domain-containing protein n=1 Tax=Myxococcus sp. RHSTA-1-4 TaxID=2874601 RepID=UPI001CC12988|nr:protein kinase [Myxococcus sp. RHSTA-1-4]MBZ4418667.1 protein kinase [Myxococcus sp. RHSTA-1-4]